VTRGYLGVIGFRRQLDRRLVRFHGLAKDHGVEIASLEPSGPAHRAGLQTGDILLSLGDQDMTSPDDLFRFLSEWPVGRPVTVTLLRRKDKLTLEVVPAAAVTRD
jgi:S1-C subfamily serine protease